MQKDMKKLANEWAAMVLTEAANGKLTLPEEVSDRESTFRLMILSIAEGILARNNRKKGGE